MLPTQSLQVSVGDVEDMSFFFGRGVVVRVAVGKCPECVPEKIAVITNRSCCWLI